MKSPALPGARWALAVGIAILATSASLRAAEYVQDFSGVANGTTDLGDGTVIGSTTGSASVQNEALQLTLDGVGSSFGSFKIPGLGAEQEQGLRILFDFSLSAAGTPADGFSVNLGPISLDPGENGAGEEGFSSGIAVEFDTYNNEGEGFDNGIGVDVSLNGGDVPGGQLREVAGANPSNNRFFRFDGSFRTVDIYIIPDGGGNSVVYVELDGETLFENLLVEGFTPVADDVIAYSARTGGATETLLIDNVALTTTASRTPRDPRITVASSLNFGVVEAGQVLDAMLMVTNDGASEILAINASSSISGPNAALFTLPSGAAQTIPPGESRNIPVRFLGSSETGPKTAALTVVSNDSSERLQNRLVNLQVIVIPSSAGLAEYVQNFDGYNNGDTDLGDGSIITSNNAAAGIFNDSLRLTQNGLGGSLSSFAIPALGEQSTMSWTADFLFSLSGGGATPADGFSFNFGPIADNATGNGEEGFGVGIAVEFDTWNNEGEGDENGIGIDVSLDGGDIPNGQLREAAGANPTDNQFFKFDGNFRPVSIIYQQTGATTGEITVILDNVTLFDALPITGISPANDWRFALSARTGGATEELLIDDLVVRAPYVEPQIYLQTFDSYDPGTDDLGDGTTITTNAPGIASVQDQALRLTADGATGTLSAFRIPAPGPAAPDSFSVRFDFALEAAGRPADGFSLNYGAIPATPDQGEEGWGTGLTVSFDTWDNDGNEDGFGNGVGYDIKANGTIVPDGFFRIDNQNWNDNEAYTFDGEFRRAEISWKKTGPDSGELSLTVAGRTFFDKLRIPGLVPQTDWIFAFGARTGGATETLLIDNVEIAAPATSAPAVRDPQIDGDRSLAVSASPGATASDSFVVINIGATQTLVLSETSSITGPGAASFDILTPLPASIPPGEMLDIELSFTGQPNIGTIEASLNLVNNDALEQARNRRIALSGVTFSQGGTYQQDFDSYPNGTQDLGDGTIFGSNNNVHQIINGALQLTLDGTGGSLGSFKIPPLGPGPTQTFIVTFDLALISAGTPADGLSFNFGSIADDPTNHGTGENGYGSGLAVEFDTYDNGNEQGIGTGIGIDVSVNGVYVGHQRIDTNAGETATSNRFYQYDGVFRPVEISWVKSGEDSGLLTLILDGEIIYQELETPGFNPTAADRFAFSARTGGAFETVLIDNLIIIGSDEDPNIVVRPNLDFGIVDSTAGEQVRPLAVRNTGGTETLEITSVSISPGGTPFSVESFPSTVAPGTETPVNVALDPSVASGLQLATLSIQSNDPSSPVTTVNLRASIPASPDLVAHYRLDETEGTDVLDASGRNRHGTYVAAGGGSFTLGADALASGTALALDDAGGNGAGYVQIPAFPQLYNFSLSMWLQRTASDEGSVSALFSKGTEDGSIPYALTLFDGLAGLGNGSPFWLVDESPVEPEFGADGVIQPGTVHHLVLTHRDDNGADLGAVRTQLYIDGVLVAAVDNPNGYTDMEIPLQIGARAGENGFTGSVDDVQVYSRILTEAEIAFLGDNPGAIVGGTAPVDPTDSDGDGMTDAQEGLAGTDPNDPSDYLHLSNTERTEEGMVVEWASKEGVDYAVEFSLSMETGSFTAINGAPIAGDGSVLRFVDSDAGRIGGEKGHWRVRALGPE
ncbi:MAG TPA: choice-of-anchor D domain-containing protein [Verrucomicrobiales bacterium]|nr:choice-of-anchor D domain-containing protein [Verrucomicrobiales bacterium]